MSAMGVYHGVKVAGEGGRVQSSVLSRKGGVRDSFAKVGSFCVSTKGKGKETCKKGKKELVCVCEQAWRGMLL